MPAERIAQNLAFINWTVLSGLAIGAFAAVVLAAHRTDATRGFLGFTAACAVLLGLLALASDLSLPRTLAGSPIEADPTWDAPRRFSLAVFVLVAAGYLITIVRRRPALPLGLAGIGAGFAVFALGAVSWSNDLFAAAPLLVQFAVLGAATGGVFAAMILGHWYLVTPKLGEGPLILFARLLTAIVALQILLFGAWMATGGGPAETAPFEPLTGEWALFVWLRLLVGLVFPLVVSWAAVQTARTRSMESATGLLYIGVGSIAAGTILASGLYFGAGLLV